MHDEIRQLDAGDEDAVIAAQVLFDGPPRADATAKFLRTDGHHLLLASAEGRPVGFVSGIEMTHPDKGTEMFLYELGVDEPFRRCGTGRALVEALLALARERGCYGMWTLADDDNAAALATYTAAGASTTAHVMPSWEFG